MDGIIGFLDFLVRFFPALEARPLAPGLPGEHARLHAVHDWHTLSRPDAMISFKMVHEQHLSGAHMSRC